jgi:hypothetical protein
MEAFTLEEQLRLELN